MELGAARSVFEKLGAATRPAPTSTRSSPGCEGPVPERSRVTKTFMFTDIVTSTDLVGMMGDADWESLLAWHDRALRSAFAAHRRHGGQPHRGWVLRQLSTGASMPWRRRCPSSAASLSIAVEHGFAPSVRIGLHTDEATIDAK